MTTLASINGPGAAGLSAKPDQRAELAKAAKAFEAIFVRQLMGEMRQAGFGDDLTGSGAVEQFQELADANTADALADKGGLGIAAMLLKQLDQTLAASPAATLTPTLTLPSASTLAPAPGIPITRADGV